MARAGVCNAEPAARPNSCSRLGDTIHVERLGGVSVDQSEETLLRISKAQRRLLRDFREGVWISTASSRPIDDLRDQACADRLLLAEHFAKAGDKLMRARPAEFRSAISRYYYSMYHAMRSAVYYHNDGDDYQEHSKLPGNTPDDFDNAADWQNNLKDARSRRNEADYDPYPTLHAEFREAAFDMAKQTHVLIDLTRGYLRKKGCAHV